MFLAPQKWDLTENMTHPAKDVAAVDKGFQASGWATRPVWVTVVTGHFSSSTSFRDVLSKEARPKMETEIWYVGSIDIYAACICVQGCWKSTTI